VGPSRLSRSPACFQAASVPCPSPHWRSLAGSGRRPRRGPELQRIFESLPLRGVHLCGCPRWQPAVTLAGTRLATQPRRDPIALAIDRRLSQRSAPLPAAPAPCDPLSGELPAPLHDPRSEPTLACPDDSDDYALPPIPAPSVARSRASRSPSGAAHARPAAAASALPARLPASAVPSAPTPSLLR